MGNRTVQWIGLYALVALGIFAASYLGARWYFSYKSSPVAPPSQETGTEPQGPVITSQRVSDDQSTTLTVLWNGYEVYRIAAVLLDSVQLDENVVRVHFALRNSPNRTEYVADLVVPQGGYPIELFAPTKGEPSNEKLVSAQDLIQILADKQEVELRIPLDPAALAD